MKQNTIKLESINKKLSELHTELISYANSLEFEEVCEFTLDNCKSIIPWNDLNFSGVYLIEIKNKYYNTNNSFDKWISDFIKRWEDPRYKKKFVSNINRKRLNLHKEKKEWLPIYIGNAKNIRKSIIDHLTIKLDQPTFSLKLDERENMREEIFRLKIIDVDNKNYEWVMPLIKKTLIKRINPITGR